MNALRLSLSAAQLPDSLARLGSVIEAAVPVGMANQSDLVGVVHTLKQVLTVKG